jgi:flagellin
MTLRINTNVAALSAHKNMIKTDADLSSSLERLSSGLRINRAADDASGMAIADSLKSQATGLGQAVRNANDGISMVQTADGALEESINIVNTIKSKAIQAAQDGQTTDSRKAIQADINKLLEELDIIAQSTAFNNQKLLSGNFTDKKFQVGAYSGETVSISIGSAEASKIGHVTTGNLSVAGAGGSMELEIYSNLNGTTYQVQAVDVGYENSPSKGMGAVADAINKLSDVLGISASAVVSSESSKAIAEGATGSDFAINGITIGKVTTLANDADGALVKAINAKSTEHGVLASTDAAGKLKLNSNDARAIKIDGSLGTSLPGEDLTTLGYVQLTQYGSNELIITNKVDGKAVDFTASVTISGDMTTTLDSELAAGSVLLSGSIIKAGSTTGVDLDSTSIGNGADISVTVDSELKSGSVIASLSIIEAGSIIGGTVGNVGDITTTADSKLASGTTIESSSVLKKGTVITTDTYTTGGSLLEAGTTLSSDTTITETTLSADMIIVSGSTMTSGSIIKADSYINSDITTSGNLSLTQDMEIKSGSTLETTGNLAVKAGSTIGGDYTVTGGATLSTSMDLKADSTIVSSSTVAAGSTVGGSMGVSNVAGLTAQSDITLASSSVIQSGSVLKKGTTLTSDIMVAGGSTLNIGTTLEQDFTTTGSNTLTADMTIKKDSTLATHSLLSANNGNAATTTLGTSETFKLDTLNVMNQENAQKAIAIAESALKDLDNIRASLGSTQNQLTSTISNLSVTKVNIMAAESSIRDVDFAEEAANFSKMQILTQASSFAMTQANASAQNVLSLLQGG